jgi:rare lipoprotein A
VPEAASDEDRVFVRTHTPIYSEEGYATWYTAAKGRHTANGDLFSDESLTAAHRTLPMGALILVTNLKTGQAAILRITDRGPFVAGRNLDLTKAAARAVGTYREGLSHVRLDVYQVPKPIHSGGKWCVQIGAFKSEEEADKLKAWLIKKYPDAKVIDFAGGSSYWVRIRPADGNREEAEKIADKVKPVEGEVYLTRLD